MNDELHAVCLNNSSLIVHHSSFKYRDHEVTDDHARRGGAAQDEGD
jgi:hypothetical protein